MRAVVCSELGPVESLSLGEFPDPVPGPGEVVIDVQAEVAGCHGEGVEAAIGSVSLGDDGEVGDEDVTMVGTGEVVFEVGESVAGGSFGFSGVEPRTGEISGGEDQDSEEAVSSFDEAEDEVVGFVIGDFGAKGAGLAEGGVSGA